MNTVCAFCEIVDQVNAGTPPSNMPSNMPSNLPSTVVFADDVAVAFLDRSPLFPGHTLVVPTRHVVTLTDLLVADVGPFFERVHRVAAAVPLALGAQGTFIANNNTVSQSVAHLHVHVVPRTKGDGLRGFFWPRQQYSPGEADTVASKIRATIEALHPR